MNYRVIPYTSEYYDFVWDLHVLNNRPYVEKYFGWNDEHCIAQHQERINSSKGFIVLSEAGNSIGCYFIKDFGENYELYRFFLNEEYQGKSIGTKIISNIKSEYASLEKPIIIYVWKDNNYMPFWIKNGFVQFDEDDHFSDMIYPYKKY